MERFVARYRPLITAVLSGFDRLVFRGTLLPLVMQGGMYTFLTRANVALLDFKPYVLATSERVKAAALREASTTTAPCATWSPAPSTRRRSRAACWPNTR